MIRKRPSTRRQRATGKELRPCRDGGRRYKRQPAAGRITRMRGWVPHSPIFGVLDRAAHRDRDRHCRPRVRRVQYPYLLFAQLDGAGYGGGRLSTEGLR
jgi:hypothetical protein